MNPNNKLIIFLVVSIIIAIYSIIKVKKSALDSNTKILLYIFSLLIPIVGLIVSMIMINRKKLSNG